MCARLPSFLLAAAILASAGPASAQSMDVPAFRVRGLVVVWAADSAGTVPVVSDFIIDSAIGRADTDLISGDVHTVVTGTLTPAFDSASSTDVASRVITIEQALSGGGSTDSNGNGQTDAGDSFAPFRIRQATNPGLAASASRSSFYVASNTPFNIDGQATGTPGRSDVDFVLSRIGWNMRVTATGNDGGIGFGAAAQLPHSSGPAGGVATFTNLLAIKTRQTVFTGNRRTARVRGNLLDQSVRFDVSYLLGDWPGYDLSVRPPGLSEGVYEVQATVVYTVWVP